MAKCVQCAAQNAMAEMFLHRNVYTAFNYRNLKRRASTMKGETARLCPVHHPKGTAKHKIHPKMVQAMKIRDEEVQS